MTTEEIDLVVGALDSLGVTLANHGHQWTNGEKAIYEESIKILWGEFDKCKRSLSSQPAAASSKAAEPELFKGSDGKIYRRSEVEWVEIDTPAAGGQYLGWYVIGTRGQIYATPIKEPRSTEAGQGAGEWTPQMVYDLISKIPSKVGGADIYQPLCDAIKADLERVKRQRDRLLAALKGLVAAVDPLDEYPQVERYFREPIRKAQRKAQAAIKESLGAGASPK